MLAQIHEETMTETEPDTQKDQDLESADGRSEFVGSNCCDVNSIYRNFKDPAPPQDHWAKRPKITERKRNALPFHAENALTWK